MAPEISCPLPQTYLTTSNLNSLLSDGAVPRGFLFGHYVVAF